MSVLSEVLVHSTFLAFLVSIPVICLPLPTMSEAAIWEVAIEEEVLSEVLTREEELPSEVVTWEEEVPSEVVTWETVIEEAVVSKALMSETESVPMIPCKAYRRNHEETYQNCQQNLFHLSSSFQIYRRFGGQ